MSGRDEVKGTAGAILAPAALDGRPLGHHVDTFGHPSGAESYRCRQFGPRAIGGDGVVGCVPRHKWRGARARVLEDLQSRRGLPCKDCTTSRAVHFASSQRRIRHLSKANGLAACSAGESAAFAVSLACKLQNPPMVIERAPWDPRVPPTREEFPSGPLRKGLIPPQLHITCFPGRRQDSRILPAFTLW